MHTIKPLNFTEAKAVEISPSANSSSNDFDFLVGKWNVKNRKLSTRLNGCTEWTEFNATGEMRKILNGIGNIDNFHTTFDGESFEGMTLRLFNPATRLWSIYWADSSVGVLDTPVVGSFDNTTGQFFGKDIYQGKEIIFMFHWDASEPDSPTWSQAFSEDHGKTWEWNWHMDMTRVSAPVETVKD
ncbi:MAG: hypothetical protein ABIQ31_21975 [Ferruginibacter sp.]